MVSNGSETPAFDSDELQGLKQKLVDGCHILDGEGITDGYGHVSIRVPGTEAFVTIAAVSPGCATLERLVMLDFDGRYLGGCGLNQIDALNQRANLGYWVRSSAAGKGVATSAAKLTRDWGFANTDLVRIEVLVASDGAFARSVRYWGINPCISTVSASRLTTEAP